MTHVLDTEKQWGVLIVDDDALVHDMTTINLRDMDYAGKRLYFLHAHSATEARKLIGRHPDIAVIILDVMMEQDDAGLGFVKHVREDTKNHDVRILLHTGQPGIAPKKEVCDRYGIDGYLDKNLADNDDCYVAVKLALRAYEERLKLKDAAPKDDICLLREISAIYSDLLAKHELLDDHETALQEINAMVHCSQNILAGYALNDMKNNAVQGTTKTERLSYSDYSALTQIHDIRVILMHTTSLQYQTEKVAIQEAVFKTAQNFSAIGILPEDVKPNLLNSIEQHEIAKAALRFTKKVM